MCDKKTIGIACFILGAAAGAAVCYYRDDIKEAAEEHYEESKEYIEEKIEELKLKLLKKKKSSKGSRKR